VTETLGEAGGKETLRKAEQDLFHRKCAPFHRPVGGCRGTLLRAKGEGKLERGISYRVAAKEDT